MTIAVVALAFLVLAVLVSWGRMAEKWAQERTELLSHLGKMADRLQHPELRQLAPVGDYERQEPPADAAELAFVGQEVPEFVKVGSQED